MEEEYKREEDEHRPVNISLLLGSDTLGYEFPIKIADLNVFNSSLSVERILGLTRAGEEECGAPGDLVSWEEAEWTLHSQAESIEVDVKTGSGRDPAGGSHRSRSSRLTLNGNKTACCIVRR